MRINVHVRLVVCAVVVCCTAFCCTPFYCTAHAQEAGATAKETAPQKTQTGEDDLGDLAKELESADEKEQADSEKQAAAARQTMDSYETRAHRQAIETRDRLLKNPQWKPTHKQVNRIELSAPLNNMCLDSQGRILACCGDKKLRVLSDSGEVLETRSLNFVPETVGVRASDGAVFVGGKGHIVRYSADGELQEKAAFPPPPSEEERKAIVEKMIKQVEDQVKQMEQMAKGIKTQLEAVNKQLAKEPVADDEKTKIAAMSEEDLFASVAGVTMTNNEIDMTFKEGTSIGIKARVLEVYLKQLGAIDMTQRKTTMEEQVRRQAEQMVGTATYTGLAVADDDLFVVCSGPGYSFNAWRMNHDFGEPKMILGGLSGCCGQMDCQTHDGNLWLAMNTQHKVLSYDRDGNELSSFGKNNAEAADGFGGCCEPKNLRFSKDGKYVYCAQSGPPVCVKRFTVDGEFQDVVCFPIYETGCVRVSVDTSGSTFYMMSPNESTIYVFQPEET